MKLKTAYFGIKLEPEIKLSVMNRARKERVQVSEWIRKAIIKELKRKVSA